MDKKTIKFLKILTISNFNINQIYPVQYTVGLGEICLVVLDFKIKTGSLGIGQEIKKKLKLVCFLQLFDLSAPSAVPRHFKFFVRLEGKNG